MLVGVAEVESYRYGGLEREADRRRKRGTTKRNHGIERRLTENGIGRDLTLVVYVEEVCFLPGM
jgi:hypothetical protein